MAKASKPTAEITQRQLNLRGLMMLGVVLVVALISYFPIKLWTDRSTRQSALAQAKASEASGNVDLALRHIERYMAVWPNDLPGLELQAKLLADTARTPAQLLDAAQANDQLLRLDPNSPDRQATRRRLIRLYVEFSDRRRQIATLRKESGEETSELRYRAALTVARQLIAKGANGAEDHRLLALALEGILFGGDQTVLDETVAEYRKAIELDPKDTLAPEHLAQVLMDKKKDQAAAEAVLNAMLQTQPNSVAARMARYKFYGRMGNEPKMTAELEAAAKLAPKNVEVQAEAANNAMQRRDFDQARRHLAAIADDPANELRARVIRGRLEWNERHPDEAVEEWRKGLVAVGGTDLDLTWQLARTLIQMNRLNEARPLISQFQRLGGKDNETMGLLLRAMYEQQAMRTIEAKNLYNRVVDQVNKRFQPEVYLALGRCYETLTDQGQAMIAYQKAALLLPSSSEPRRAISRILALKNPTEALTEMDRALIQNPNDLALLVEVGRFRLRQQVLLPEGKRSWAEVDSIVDRASRIESDNFAVQTLKADVLAASGRLNQALDFLRTSVEGPGKNKPEVWLSYAGALNRLNRRDEALRVLERGSQPDAAGDHANLRIGRAQLLGNLNQAQAARELLTVGRDKLPPSERPQLPKALSVLCRELGDRDGARAALADWAKLLPDSPEPGLALISLAQAYNDDEAARLGLDALRTLGSDHEPYNLAARALELLRLHEVPADSTKQTVATDPAELERLDRADRLVAQLAEEAPQMAIVPMLQGLIFERRGKYDQAIEAYRRSIRDGSMTASLVRLVELLSRQNRFDEIDQLKAQYEGRANQDGTPSLVTSFDQITAAVAIKLGDKQKAVNSVDDMLKATPDDLSLRISKARLLVEMGKVKEGEATLRELANRRADTPSPWLALVAYRSQHRELGDLNKLIDEVRVGYKGAHPELLVARCRWAVEDISGAAKAYDAAVAQNGDDLTTLRDAIEFDEGNGRLKEAEAKLRRALKIDPKATWASRRLAMLLARQSDRSSWQEAWSLIKSDAPGAGQTPEDRLARALVQARSPERSQRDGAVLAMQALANDLPASNPIAVDSRFQLTQAFLEINNFGQAARMIAPVADDTDRPNATALALATEALARSKDVAGAAKRLERLEALEPRSPRTAASKSWVLMESGKNAEAIQVIEASYAEAEATPNGEVVALAFQALLVKMKLKDAALLLAGRIATKWPRYAFILAQAQLANKQIPDAIKSCRVALEAGSVRDATRVAMNIAVEKRDDPRTLQVIDELASYSLTHTPKDPEVLNYVALLRHLQGRFDEEVALYRQVLDNSPQSYLFLNNMAWTLCEAVQRYDEALERIDEAIRRDGRAAQFLDTRGVILARLGRLKEAATDLEESIRLEEEAIKQDRLSNKTPSATTYFHLARTYRQLNQLDDYRRCRDMARKLKLDPGSLDPPDKADLSSVMDGN